MPRMPVLFVSHGSPMLALDAEWGPGEWSRVLLNWGSRFAPKAIVAISAHWESDGVIRVTASPRPGILHDFGGFPPELYRLEYPAPGDPALGKRLVARLREAGLASEPDAQRALDHGVWVPLRAAFPAAQVPVVQISLPRPRTPATLVRLGRALAPLRYEGVLLMASGGLVHNLALLDWEHPDPQVAGQAGPPAWAQAFEVWMRTAVEDGDLEALIAAPRLAPSFHLAVPTTEHLDPLYVAIGAAGNDSPAMLFEGWQHGSLSLSAWVWGDSDKIPG